MHAPIYNLPADIITEIIFIGKDMDEETFPSGEGDDLPFEYVASHICSYFRQIALTSPLLWVSIRLHARCHLDNINARLERSGTCGLHIRVEAGEQDYPISSSKMDALIALIIPYSAQWHTLYLRHRSEGVIKLVCSAPAPNLRLLSVSVDEVRDMNVTLVNRTMSIPNLFDTGTPHLGFIRVRGFALQFFRPEFFALVTLHLDATKHLPILYSTLRDILTISPLLEHLSMYGDILSPGGWNTTHPKMLKLPGLRSLRLYSESGEAYSGMLNILDAPMLESLTLKYALEHDLDSFLVHPIQRFQFPNLSVLQFIDCHFSDATIEKIFEAFQNITSFIDLSVPIGHNDVIKLLSQGMLADSSSPTGYALPWRKLATVGFVLDIWDVYELSIWDTMLEARKECGLPITTCMVTIDDDEGSFEYELEGRGDLKMKMCKGDLPWPSTCSRSDHEDTLFHM